MAPNTALFLRQTWALTKKNLTIAIVRCWLSTIIRALLIPIALVAIVLEIPNFGGGDPNTYGIGSPAPVESLADSLSDGKPLAIVEKPGLGPDFREVYDKIVGPLDSSLVLKVSSEDDVHDACDVDFHGHSNCHAVIIFNDSPLSGRENAMWNYSLLADPSRVNSGVFNVKTHTSDIESFLYPLQVAIENAMANSSVTPETVTYADSLPGAALSAKDEFLNMALYILSFVFFISMCTMVHHVSSMMGKERRRGLSQLADAMSGGMSTARVVSYILTFDLLYLPTWIILGTLYGRLLCPTSNTAVFIFWHILTGWALTSASVFAAAFFPNEALAGTIVPGLSLLLAVLAAWQDNLSKNMPKAGEIAALSLFFPSSNFVFFLDFAIKAEYLEQPVDLVAALHLTKNPDTIPYAQWLEYDTWVNHLCPIVLWALLIVQIIGYLALATAVEHLLHGNNRRHRTFRTETAADASFAAIETTDLEKCYEPTLFKRIFSRAAATKAVDGLSLVSHKQQILCLLGPNGSGKTTTLDMLAGFIAPTAGNIRINAAPSQIGVCPQRNVLWDNLTVYEHLQLWNTLKGGQEVHEQLETLLEMCDLVRKKDALAGRLSGGTKRRLQLACMLVGGSSVCLLDEVTSGLDPISRRVIWNAVLNERSRRTMILTTHFLDECEVLSDHIVIISLGRVKCQGMPAELKAQYGSGYRVHIPKKNDVSEIEYPVEEKGDRYVVTTPDSSSAAKLLSRLEGTENSGELFITGPTVEDVFLAVSDVSETLHQANIPDGPSIEESSSSPAGSKSIPRGWRLFFRQFWALFTKRLLILRSQWWIYLLVLAIPIVFSSPPIIGTFLYKYVPPTCASLLKDAEQPYSVVDTVGMGWVIGPEAANTSIVNAANELYEHAYNNPPFAPGSSYTDGTVVKNTSTEFLSYIADNAATIYFGGLFLDNGSAPLVAASAWDPYTAMSVMNVAIATSTGVSINVLMGELLSLQSYQDGSTVIWVSVVCLLHTVWPAFFALYPTYERKNQVRALQYSNGVRTLPLWLSHALFDFMFVIVVAGVSAALIPAQFSLFWGVGYIAVVLLLYGIAAMLMAYILSMFAGSQPAACALAIAVMIVEYIICSIVVITSATGHTFNQATLDGTTFGLGILFPIQNVLRAYMLGLNEFIVRCRGTTSVDNSGSIYGYGGPILFLILQIMGFFFVLLCLDGSLFTFRRKSKALVQDDEKSVSHAGTDVFAETKRVESSTDDLLRIFHVSKSFGACKAVDDVSLGLQKGEILALLGPNGAGKTTTINMIRGQLPPTSGQIFLENISVQSNTRLAQARLGVCPQFDALDLLTVREHLTLYARCKAVSDIATEVTSVMAKVGITVHANKRAAKLSGGNKRKLSLAIALLGNPPVLLLDEPGTAMDAASRRVFWKILAAVAPGRSVLLTTHSMEEADYLATRAAIMASRLLAIGTTQELRMRHSNEYHGQLILRSAPLSTRAEMQAVAELVGQTCPEMRLESEPLGGQVRFVVPADAQVPEGAGRVGFVGYLIEALEANKERLGINCYSIGLATMERVFMSVMKDSDVVEEEEKRPWWKKL